MGKYYTCQEVADLYHVKIITVYDWLRKKKLTGLRIGKRYCISQEDLEQMEARARQAQSAP